MKLTVIGDCNDVCTFNEVTSQNLIPGLTIQTVEEISWRNLNRKISSTRSISARPTMTNASLNREPAFYNNLEAIIDSDYILLALNRANVMFTPWILSYVKQDVTALQHLENSWSNVYTKFITETLEQYFSPSQIILSASMGTHVAEWNDVLAHMKLTNYSGKPAPTIQERNDLNDVFNQKLTNFVAERGYKLFDCRAELFDVETGLLKSHCQCMDRHMLSVDDTQRDCIMAPVEYANCIKMLLGL